MSARSCMKPGPPLHHVCVPPSLTTTAVLLRQGLFTEPGAQVIHLSLFSLALGLQALAAILNLGPH